MSQSTICCLTRLAKEKINLITYTFWIFSDTLFALTLEFLILGTILKNNYVCRRNGSKSNTVYVTKIKFGYQAFGKKFVQQILFK